MDNYSSSSSESELIVAQVKRRIKRSKQRFTNLSSSGSNSSEYAEIARATIAKRKAETDFIENFASKKRAREEQILLTIHNQAERLRHSQGLFQSTPGPSRLSKTSEEVSAISQSQIEAHDELFQNLDGSSSSSSDSVHELDGIVTLDLSLEDAEGIDQNVESDDNATFQDDIGSEHEEEPAQNIDVAYGDSESDEDAMFSHEIVSESEEELEDIDRHSELMKKLRNFCNKPSVTDEIAREVLGMFNFMGINVPKDPRTVQKRNRRKITPEKI